MFVVDFQARMGKKDGFGNVLTKQLHDTSTALVPKTKLTVHENVPDFTEDQYLVEETGFTIQKAELLDNCKCCSFWHIQFQSNPSVCFEIDSF